MLISESIVWSLELFLDPVVLRLVGCEVHPAQAVVGPRLKFARSRVSGRDARIRIASSPVSARPGRAVAGLFSAGGCARRHPRSPGIGLGDLKRNPHGKFITRFPRRLSNAMFQGSNPILRFSRGGPPGTWASKAPSRASWKGSGAVSASSSFSARST
jgi:hypothetical protein